MSAHVTNAGVIHVEVSQERHALSVPEVSRSLGISIPQVYKAINARELRTFTIGTRRLVSNQALAEYIKARESVSTAPVR